MDFEVHRGGQFVQVLFLCDLHAYLYYRLHWVDDGVSHDFGPANESESQEKWMIA